MRTALEKAGFKAELAEVTIKPTTENAMTGEDAARMQKLLDALESDRRRPGGLYHRGAGELTIRILGIDPGLRVTGFGVIDKTGQQAHLRHQRLHPDARTASSARRLKTILDGPRRGHRRAHGPAQVAIEKVFVNANPQSTLLLGQARGTAICAAVLHGLPVAEYTALQVKQAVVGNGHARQGAGAGDGAAAAASSRGDPSPDAADALACAICHAHGGQGLGRLATAGYRMKRGRLV